MVGSHTDTVYIFDYEFFKLVGEIKLKKGVEPTAFSIMNGFPVMIIGTSDSFIYILKFSIV